MSKELLIYNASAGSGKTHNLSEQFAKYLLEGGPEAYKHQMAVEAFHNAFSHPAKADPSHTVQAGFVLPLPSGSLIFLASPTADTQRVILPLTANCKTELCKKRDELFLPCRHGILHQFHTVHLQHLIG